MSARVVIADDIRVYIAYRHSDLVRALPEPTRHYDRAIGAWVVDLDQLDALRANLDRAGLTVEVADERPHLTAVDRLRRAHQNSPLLRGRPAPTNKPR